MTEPLTRNGSAVTRRRLWLGVLVPPAVWVTHSAAGFFIVVGLCRHGGREALARVLVLVLTAVAAVTTAALAFVAFGSWRRLRDGENLAFAEARGQDEWLAAIGVYGAASLTLGVLWGGLQSMVMSGLCEAAR